MDEEHENKMSSPNNNSQQKNMYTTPCGMYSCFLGVMPSKDTSTKATPPSYESPMTFCFLTEGHSLYPEVHLLC